MADIFRQCLNSGGGGGILYNMFGTLLCREACSHVMVSLPKTATSKVETSSTAGKSRIT